jgi:hypothetical protein
MSRKSITPAWTARTSRWCCHSMPALQTGHLVLYQTVSVELARGLCSGIVTLRTVFQLPRSAAGELNLPRLFISHSSRDDLAAEAMRIHLVERGWNRKEIFLDFDVGGISAHQKWKASLAEANSGANALLCLASPDWLASKESQVERRVAETLRDLDRRGSRAVLVAILRNLTLDDLRAEGFGEDQIVDLSAVRVEDVRRRLHAIDAEGRLHVGADCAIAIWLRTPGDGWLGRVLSLPGIQQIARFGYDRFADLLYAWNQNFFKSIFPWVSNCGVQAVGFRTDGANVLTGSGRTVHLCNAKGGSGS